MFSNSLEKNQEGDSKNFKTNQKYIERLQFTFTMTDKRKKNLTILLQQLELR